MKIRSKSIFKEQKKNKINSRLTELSVNKTKTLDAFFVSTYMLTVVKLFLETHGLERLSKSNLSAIE
jgi:hypothetical protein